MPNPTGTINADEDHSGKTITNVPNPSAAQDVATKAYADSISAGGVNAFGTIVVAGQSNVIADTAPDTLTLVAGANVTLTTNASTDTVTIAASGGGGSGTVTTTGSPTSGDVAQFSGATSITGVSTIALSQLPQGTNGQLIVGQTGGAPQYKTITGDVTVGFTGATLISNDAVHSYQILDGAVSLAKMADIATDSILGRSTASTGDPEVLTALPFADTGDVTRPADSNATTIANDAVTYAKMQNVSAASKLLGRGDSGSGDVEQITLGGNLTMTGTTLDTTAGSAGVSDAAYDSSWNGVTGTAPSKNAVYDALQTIGSSGTTVKVAGSDFTTSSVSLVDITGLSFAASANKLYEIDALLKVESSSAAGLKVGIQYSAAGASCSVGVWGGLGLSTSAAVSCLDALNNSSSSNFGTVAATPRFIFFKGCLTTGANVGNITIQIMKITSGTATVYIGSRMTVSALT